MGAETPNASHDNCNDCVAFDACFIKNITVNDRFFAIQSRMEENGGDFDEAENYVNSLFPTQQEIQSAIDDHEQQEQSNSAQLQDSLIQPITSIENLNSQPETNMPEVPAPTIEIDPFDPNIENSDSGSFWFQPPASGLDRGEPQTPGDHGTQNGTEGGNDHGQDYGHDQMGADQQQGEQPPGSEYQTIFNPETGLNEIVFDRVTPDQKKQIETLNTAFIDTMSADYQASASFGSAEGKLFLNSDGKLDIFDPVTGKGILESYVEYPGGVTKAEFESAIQSIFKDGQAVIDHYVDGVAKYRTIYILDANHGVQTIYLELPSQAHATDDGDTAPDSAAENAAASPENSSALQETEDSDDDNSVDNNFVAAKTAAREAKSSGAGFFDRLKNEGAVSKVADLKKFAAESQVAIRPETAADPKAAAIRPEIQPTPQQSVEPQMDHQAEIGNGITPIPAQESGRIEQHIDQQTYFEAVMATGGITLEGVSPVLAQEQTVHGESQNLNEVENNLTRPKQERSQSSQKTEQHVGKKIQQETADHEKADGKNSVDKDDNQNFINANNGAAHSASIRGRSSTGTNPSAGARGAVKTAKPATKVFGVRQSDFGESAVSDPNLLAPDRGPKNNGGPRLQKDSISGESTIAQSFVEESKGLVPAKEPAKLTGPADAKIPENLNGFVKKDIQLAIDNIEANEVETAIVEPGKEVEVIPDIIQEVADILETKEIDDIIDRAAQPIDLPAEAVKPVAIQKPELKDTQADTARVVRQPDAVRRPFVIEKPVVIERNRPESINNQQLANQQFTQREAKFKREQTQIQAEAVQQVQEALKALAEWREASSRAERGENTTPSQSGRGNSASQQQDDNERAPLNPTAQAEELALAA